MNKSKNIYWHFLPDDCRLRWGTKEIVNPLHTLIHPPDFKPILCQQGFHASRQALDALRYAPGNVACMVTLHGTILHDTDKSVAQGRTVLAMKNVESVLRLFARQQALSVIDKWDAPPIVVQYLNTGDESIRAAARAAAGAAAGAAAWDAAWAAARDAANTMLEGMLKKELGWS